MIDSFTGKMPALIPFTSENEPMLKLASYLLKYTIGSRATLYQYVFGIYRFCNWLDVKPDDMVRDAFSDRVNVDKCVEKIDAFKGDLQADSSHRQHLVDN